MSAEMLSNWSRNIENVLPGIIAVLLCIILAIIVGIAVLNLLNLWWLIKRKNALLELTPPANTNKSLAATRQLFSALHGLESSRNLWDKVSRRRVVFSLEVASTRQQGIRYILHVPEKEVSSFEQAVVAYLPDVKFRRIEDYARDINMREHILEVKQTGHFAYPLHSQGELWEYDPMAYLTGAMTKLPPGELVALQLVVVPTKVREAYTISKRLLHNEELVSRLGKRKLPIFGAVFSTINAILFAILDAIGDMVSGTSSKSYSSNRAQNQHKQQVAMKIKPARILSPIEQKLAESVHYKLNQPLFSVNIRALIASEDREQAKQRTKGIRDWLSLFRFAKYQALKPRPTFVPQLQRQYRLFNFKHRLSSMFKGSSNLLAASEIADLYHFPHNKTTKTENVVKSLSKTLSVPLAIKNNKFDVVLGRNNHHDTSLPIGLTAKERERHVYIIGGTGNGKTTMIEYGIVQDIQNGKGVAVIDPHGDLAERLLRHVPEDRINDVIYFKPSDLSYPIGLNLLELPEGLSDDELLDAKDFITEAVISVMRKTFSDDDTGGHRIEYVLRNAVQTALTIKDATLFTIFDLLTDNTYRKKIVRSLENQKLKNFWNNEFGKAGNFQRVKMAAGVTAKIGRFQFSASAERIMSQPKSTINFEEILDGKILICNFAKGLIGEDTSELFGISTLAKLQLAAYRRVKQEQSNRKPFYLYVDEFQNFATMSFVQMLSEARKYKVFLTMAEQSTSQQDDLRMVNTILANVGTVICFRSGNPADERLLLPLFKPYIEEGEIANLPTFNFYARMSAIISQEPVSGETILLNDNGNEGIAQRVIDASRSNYAEKYNPAVESKSKPKQKRTARHQPQNSKVGISGKPQD